jgi:6-phosphofructokinase 1
MIIIPEMFNKTGISLDKIVRLVISSIIKRKILNISYGVAIISEGVFHTLSDEEIESTGISFTYDAHGHPELGTVSKAHIFNILVQNKLNALGIDIKTRPVELGYELRCVPPKAFDLMYCNLLGIGVKILYDQKETGCMVSADVNGNIRPIHLKDMEDPVTGKIEPRLVNIDGSKARIIYEHALHYITADDYSEAKKYLKNPEEYDFNRILNWTN